MHAIVSSDAEAILCYANENATQRGESSTAGIGTISAATWLLAGAAMRGCICTIVQIHADDAAKVQGNLASEKGLGRDILKQFLGKVSGLTGRQV